MYPVSHATETDHPVPASQERGDGSTSCDLCEGRSNTGQISAKLHEGEGLVGVAVSTALSLLQRRRRYLA